MVRGMRRMMALLRSSCLFLHLHRSRCSGGLRVESQSHPPPAETVVIKKRDRVLHSSPRRFCLICNVNGVML
ncbi:hypothetical protein F5Y14DRAFT_418768 [Nemania sp. NC0429]|nr:hypothetical protein F5Y14DRAFT_418768 [Nemania sp. NC0429]